MLLFIGPLVEGLPILYRPALGLAKLLVVMCGRDRQVVKRRVNVRSVVQEQMLGLSTKLTFGYAI